MGGLKSHQAIALGALRNDLPNEVQITTARKLADLNGSATSQIIARTAEHIGYHPHRAAVILLDFDTKGMPEEVRRRLQSVGGFWNALLKVVPDFASAGTVTRRSTSSGITRSDTNQPIDGSDGVHVFLHVQDGGDAERCLKTLHDRCWLKGFGWSMVGAGGTVLERSIVDRTVYSAERLVFEGAPILEEPLTQDANQRTPIVFDGQPLNTVTAVRPLTVVETAELSAKKEAERYRLSAASAKARAAFVQSQAARIVARTGVSQAKAKRTVEQQCKGILLPDVELPFDAEDLDGCTVRDVLSNPERFVGATLADPLEGVAYGRTKAKVMRRADGTMWIHSFAHGRTIYELKVDAAAVEAAIKAAEANDAADVFVDQIKAADLAADEEQRLLELAAQRAGVKLRPMAQKVKHARAEFDAQRAADRREQTAATRLDRRLRLEVPQHDAERTPVLEALDEILCAVPEAEPPMRDLDGNPVEVRNRQPLMLHELTSGGSNQDNNERTRLPAPEMPLLTQHDKYSLAHTIEHHVEYFENKGDGDTRSVALPPVFVDHYKAYRDSALPRVGAVVTAPLVLMDGSMLAPAGLERSRQLVFRIAPELLRILPSPNEPAPHDGRVTRAFDFLVNRWLVDVATDFRGKCVLIALALTSIERVLLPMRPAFFVTAGKRGGGKTTALSMIILAVTGKKPAAAAWSFSEEERRKALLAYLEQGLPALVFDNVPLGTTISCPTIEKILTAESYQDRILTQTAIATVPAFTVLSFTGNNIGPRGDLASRSLMVRLDVDRPDPENRPFQHSDPMAWTLENQGQILRALYTVLLGNPQLRTPTPPKTRFKRWWTLVATAVEHAAKSLAEAEARSEVVANCPASEVNFASLFNDLETEDEDTLALANVLDILNRRYVAGFTSSDVAGLINAPSEYEHDTVAELRAFFENQNRRPSGSLGAITIGKRLGNCIDAPVFVGGRTLKLVRTQPANQAEQRKVARFKIIEPGKLGS